MKVVRQSLLVVAPRPGVIGSLLRRAVPGVFVRDITTVQEALEAVRQEAPRVLLCEPRDATGQRTEPLLESVAAQFGTVGLVGIIPDRWADATAIARLVSAGAHTLLFANSRTMSLDCRRVLVEASVRCAVSGVSARLLAAVPSSTRSLMEYGLKYGDEPLTVDGVARALFVTRKTLYWRSVQAGLPAPQQLLGWCRLLAASSLLEDRGRRVDHIALDLNFPSGTALRNLLHRYCGLSPQALRDRGAVREVTTRLLQVLMAHR